MNKAPLSLFLPLVLSSLALAQNCGIPPIYVDIHDRNVTGSSVYQYGSFIGVGSPSQNQSLWPTFNRNETLVTDINFCSHSDDPDCSNNTRGFFDSTKSSTWGPNDSYTPKDLQHVTGDQTTYGNDILHLFTHYFTTDPASATNVSGFTFEVATAGDIQPGTVGLGPSSTLLQTLVDKSLVAGRTISLYIGNAMSRAGGEAIGSSTYGGFDSSRFTGEVFKSSIDTAGGYPFTVTVTDIQINDSSGNSTSLLDGSKFHNIPEGSSSFEAEIGTDEYTFSLPYEITQNFASVLHASPGPDESLILNESFDGNMTITLSNGFTVTLPSNITANSNGSSAVSDRDQNSTSPFYLGVAWLTQVYLMVDYDSSFFYLAQAVEWPPFNTPRTFCPGSIPEPYKPPSTKGLDTQGLAGAVVGGIIGGSALLTVVFCAFRTLQRKRIARYVRMSNEKIMEMTEQGEREGRDLQSPEPLLMKS